MANVLISAIYNHNSIMLCATRFSINEIYLIVDKKPNPQQKKAVEIIMNSLGSFVKIHEINIAAYDILGNARRTVKIIDTIQEGSDVFINVTSGRRTQSLGIMYGAYTRIKKIKYIVYVTEDTKEVIYLPKLSFNITETQRQMLEMISKNTLTSIFKLSEKVSTSTAMAYRNYESLKEKGMIIQSKNKIELTDYGKLVLL